ncbi:MAG: ATP-binding protein [Tenericutes bacterium]|nr:ATP-binding protein [Mycoplasmatota bacterium]
MIGKIISIEKNIVLLKLGIEIANQTNLINVHVVFEDENKKIVGEIMDILDDTAKVSIVGTIDNNTFIPGSITKPAFRSNVRIISSFELSQIFGNQIINDNSEIYLGGSTIYNGYNINVNINNFFSNHFAIIGNTGSGKSFSVARILQNIFSTSKTPPFRSSFFIFDAYGEYHNALRGISSINQGLNYKTYTTNLTQPEGEILKIPVWLMDIDDIALLLGASDHAQLPIIEKTLKLVTVLTNFNGEVTSYKNDIIARALLDILLSGTASSKIRDQITAVLSKFNTEELSLNTIIVQPGYNRPLKQLLYVDDQGKIQEIERVIEFLQQFILPEYELNLPDENYQYSLRDLENAMEFALVSEGILKSDKVFDYANILLVRLHSLVNSNISTFFDYHEIVDKRTYINNLRTTSTGQRAQIVNFNINYVDDRIAKVMTKIISKMLLDYEVSLPERASEPIHIVIEEAHRYVQNDNDNFLLGYNIFERITKEGRKYGLLLGLITQRPSELSDTCVSQSSNFLVFRMLHPKDLTYISEMVPNISSELIQLIKSQQPGSCMAFGSAFKIPIAIKLEKPNPEPLSNNANIVNSWFNNY